MLVIEKETFKLNPLIDVVNNHHLIPDLWDGVEEYLTDNLRQTYLRAKPVQVFFISGQAGYHNDQLMRYLNSHVLKPLGCYAKLVNGTLAGYPMSHYWIMIEDLIIDLTLKQFSQSRINPELKKAADCECFICDNPTNKLYQLYKTETR